MNPNICVCIVSNHFEYDIPAIYIYIDIDIYIVETIKNIHILVEATSSNPYIVTLYKTLYTHNHNNIIQ